MSRCLSSGIPMPVSRMANRRRAEPPPSWTTEALSSISPSAVKFTAEGEIELSASVVHEGGGSARLRFAIRDTGIGIPEDKQRLIFEAFTQADGSTTRKYGGTGLGLTISSRLVAMMGGKIAVTSEAGRGSEFSFEADFGIQKEQSRPADSRSLAYIRDFNVLIVDDNL